MHERAVEFTDRARSELSLDVEVREFPDGTKTARDAAEAIGCDVGQIASSLAFEAAGLVVVVTSGANRVDEAVLANLRSVAGADVEMADPDTIKSTLGWSIGGVPPFLHETDVPVYVDETLMDYETVWAAAGTPQTVFPIAPERLRDVAGATVVDVTDPDA